MASHTQKPMVITVPNRWCIAALFVGFFYLPAVGAQALRVEQAPQSAEHRGAPSPVCDPDSIDTTFTFANLPGSEQTITLHFRNKSDAACRIYGPAGVSFASGVDSMSVNNCWLCDQNHRSSLAPDRQPGNEFILAPDERAAVDLEWASAGRSCEWADWANISLRWAVDHRYPYGYIFTPSEWPMRICSPVMSAGYRADADQLSTGQMSAVVLNVSVAQSPIYSDEQVRLHAELSGQTLPPTPPVGCASLYSVRQGPTIGVRFAPLLTQGSTSKRSYTPEQIKEDKQRKWPPSPWKTDHLRTCAIPSGRAIADVDISAEDLADVTHIEWRTASPPNDIPTFAMAPTHFNVLDADSLAPNWGGSEGGIRAGLSVDRDHFRLNEQIPVHLRWENVNAAMPLAEGECWIPTAVEIQGSRHVVVQTILIQWLCPGHGRGPIAMPEGKPRRTFFALSTESPATAVFDTHPNTYDPLTGTTRAVLPGAGVYYLVAVWSPHVLEPFDPETNKTPVLPGMGEGQFGKIYATARSLPVRIELAPANDR